jgi:hypothetical protein
MLKVALNTKNQSINGKEQNYHDGGYDRPQPLRTI